MWNQSVSFDLCTVHTYIVNGCEIPGLKNQIIYTKLDKCKINSDTMTFKKKKQQVLKSAACGIPIGCLTLEIIQNIFPSAHSIFDLYTLTPCSTSRQDLDRIPDTYYIFVFIQHLKCICRLSEVRYFL